MHFSASIEFGVSLHSNDTYFFTGKIRFSKPFMIKGTVNGTIEATSDLVVDTDAVLHTDITAERVLIKGAVTGDVNAKKLVFVTATGSITGDITTAQIVLEPGCSFSGRCSMV